MYLLPITNLFLLLFHQSRRILLTWRLHPNMISATTCPKQIHYLTLIRLRILLLPPKSLHHQNTFQISTFPIPHRLLRPRLLMHLVEWGMIQHGNGRLILYVLRAPVHIRLRVPVTSMVVALLFVRIITRQPNHRYR